MARYIDADALIERILKLKVVTGDMYGMGVARGIERAETAIQMQPTADVVPKSEVERLEKECKYWETEAKEARADLTESTQEVAREIFEEVEKFNRPPLPECEPVYIIKARELAELKKKYAEEDNE